MSKGAQRQLAKTSALPFPNVYVQALQGEFSEWAFCEVRAKQKKGAWREEFFTKEGGDGPIDLEIGTGNGVHFAHQAQKHPERGLIGIELKYKPLIQAIRRARKANLNNARMLRYNAAMIEDLFVEGEIDHVYIHFPDPWSKKGQKKHRLIQPEFLTQLHQAQKPGCQLEFKTDNKDYFNHALDVFHGSSYRVKTIEYDLHNSTFVKDNFITSFESYFLREGLPIYFLRAQVKDSP